MASGGTGVVRWMVRGALTLAIGALTATAVTAAPAAPTTKTVEATGTVARTNAEAVVEPLEAPGCTRVRRRLWVEGEGWIVRRVTTCH